MLSYPATEAHVNIDLSYPTLSICNSIKKGVLYNITNSTGNLELITAAKLNINVTQSCFIETQVTSQERERIAADIICLFICKKIQEKLSYTPQLKSDSPRPRSS